MAEKNLQVLLSSMKPHLQSEEYVFCTVGKKEFASLSFAPLCVFHEEEGVTLIVEKQVAQNASLQYSGSWALITCTINSDLTAVGFLAAMSTALADAGIAVNAVSAYYHDHLFVPAARAQEALQILQELSAPSD